MKKLIVDLFSQFDSIGALQDGGYTRLAYTHTEDEMHKLFAKIAKEKGYRVWVDSIGNTYVANFIEGTKGFTLIGSHLDSVIEGGKYDGPSGVFCGLAILEEIKKQNLNIPICVVAFRCEESSNFKICTVGSGIITNTIEPEIIARAENKKGEKLLDAIKNYGYKVGEEFNFDYNRYIELHIEQARVLESSNTQIGVVSAIASPYRYVIELVGMAEHSGATPMNIRKDSLCAAAEIILAIENAGKKESINDSVATVGSIDNTPNIMNAVPGKTTLMVDIRGINEDSIKRIAESMENSVKEICAKRQIKYLINVADQKSPVLLDKKMQNDLCKSAKELGLSYRIMPSGAGHDAMSFANICPTCMIFVPCKDGISHNILEYAEIDDIVNGAKVILNYLKNYPA